jgi:hypothetical protein
MLKPVVYKRTTVNSVLPQAYKVSSNIKETPTWELYIRWRERKAQEYNEILQLPNTVHSASARQAVPVDQV